MDRRDEKLRVVGRYVVTVCELGVPSYVSGVFFSVERNRFELYERGGVVSFLCWSEIEWIKDGDERGAALERWLGHLISLCAGH